MRVLVVALLLTLVGESLAMRILGINPTLSFSHQRPFLIIMEALASRGHQVTIINTHPLQGTQENITQINISHLVPVEEDEIKEKLEELTKTSHYELQEMVLPMASIQCDSTFEHPEIRALISSRQKFDLVVLETLFHWYYFGLIHSLGSPPVVGFLSFGMTPIVSSLMGSPFNPAYVPECNSEFTDHMSFWERMRNAYDVFRIVHSFQNKVIPFHDQLIQKHFGEDLPPLVDMVHNMSLVVVSNHFSIDYPQPLLPNIIQVTGLHIETKWNPLPKEIQDFLDGAKRGFIYFSLGSNMKSSYLPEETINSFLKAFSELPERVLWKFEMDNLPDKPDNVMISKWLPQQDVLAHPNIRLFITQGGLQSFNEAVYFGVPLVGIPFFFDQKYEVAKMVSAGIGKKLDLDRMSKQYALEVINEVLRDTSYQQNMRRLSAVYREHQATSLERAVWWLEYVVRHQGAPHLRSAALDLRWWQLLLLDVVAVLLLVVVASLLVMYQALRHCRRLFTGRRKEKAA